MADPKDSPGAPEGGDRRGVRLEIAFEGGHALGVVVPSASADGLEQALANDGQGIFELDADDGRYLLPLRSVVYVKRFSRETPIGFGGFR